VDSLAIGRARCHDTDLSFLFFLALNLQVAEQPYEQLGEGLKGKVDQALKSAEKESKVEKKMKRAAVKKNNPKVSGLRL